MRILGIDTATHRATVAVISDAATCAEVTIDSRSHAAAIVPLIDSVMQQARCTVETLDAIAVSVGPGSFTGLRVGLSVAKGIACATGARVIPIPTLEALAHAAPVTAGVICPVLDARKGELYAACFERNGDRWRVHLEASLLSPERLAATLPAQCTVLGDGVLRYGNFLKTELGDRLTLLPWPQYGPRASVVAQLAVARLHHGTVTDGHDIEPFYVRPSDAETRMA